MRHNRGFTLIELLAVLVAIAVLVAFLLPAVQSARRTVQDAAAKSELTNFNSAMTAFRNEFGCYPPSSITLYNTAAGWRGDPQSLSKVQRMFPNFDPSGPMPWDPTIPTQSEVAPKPGCRMSHMTTYPKTLNGAECLLFFLGGPLYGTTYDSSGNVTKWGQPIGFSKNPAYPFSLSVAETRSGPFITLKSDRFTDVDDDGIPEYADMLPSQSWPILYALSDGQGYTSTDLVVSNNAMIPNPLYDILSAYTRAGVELNRPTFQLISPGRDSLYGAGGDYDTTKGDNFANF